MSERLELAFADAVAELAKRALALVGDQRIAIALAGGPGSGKSTLAKALTDAVSGTVPAQMVPMDGFHMAHAKLEALALVARKGAAETFEAEAFVGFVVQVLDADEPVAGPVYDRSIEDVVADAYEIAPETRVLVIEGNYLLLSEPPWDRLRNLFALAVFLEVPRETVRTRLMKRHAEHGLFTAERNRRHIETVDLPNHDCVAATAGRADVILAIPERCEAP